ncbi:MAG: hypothetical protein BWK79_19860, partial [Beggiatoa sp. IS2]
MTHCIKPIILFLSSVFFIAGCSVVDTVVDKFKTKEKTEETKEKTEEIKEKVEETAEKTEKTKVEKEWTPVEQIDRIVWADDASEVAIVMLHSEEQKTENATEKRYFKHQIFTQKLDSTEKSPLTELRDHQVGQIFFMKSAGYLITESISQDDTRRFDKIDMKGHEILIIETPDKTHQPCQ